MKKVIGLAIVAAVGAGGAQAGLIGDTINVGYNLQASSSTDVVVVGNGVELTCPGSANLCFALTAPTQTVDFTDTGIVYSYIGAGAGFTLVTPNGFEITDLDFDNGDVLTGFVLAPGLLDSSRVSFTSSSISINMAGLVLSDLGSGFTLNFVTGPGNTVSAPTSAALLSLALVGLALLRRRRRSR